VREIRALLELIGDSPALLVGTALVVPLPTIIGHESALPEAERKL
jgi:hypothetical protein